MPCSACCKWLISHFGPSGLGWVAMSDDDAPRRKGKGGEGGKGGKGGGGGGGKRGGKGKGSEAERPGSGAVTRLK
eukprot:2215917-Amphidinium_carterae.1